MVAASRGDSERVDLACLQCAVRSGPSLRGSGATCRSRYSAHWHNVGERVRVTDAAAANCQPSSSHHWRMLRMVVEPDTGEAAAAGTANLKEARQGPARSPRGPPRSPRLPPLGTAGAASPGRPVAGPNLNASFEYSVVLTVWLGSWVLGIALQYMINRQRAKTSRTNWYQLKKFRRVCGGAIMMSGCVSMSMHSMPAHQSRAASNPNPGSDIRPCKAAPLWYGLGCSSLKLGLNSSGLKNQAWAKNDTY